MIAIDPLPQIFAAPVLECGSHKCPLCYYEETSFGPILPLSNGLGVGFIERCVVIAETLYMYKYQWGGATRARFAGWYRPGGPPFLSGVCRSFRCMEGFLIRGWQYVHPGWRWLHEPQPISNQPVGLGFLHLAGRYRPGGPPFTSPICWSCRCMEIFLIRGWDPILPGWRWLVLTLWLE